MNWLMYLPICIWWKGVPWDWLFAKTSEIVLTFCLHFWSTWFFDMFFSFLWTAGWLLLTFCTLFIIWSGMVVFQFLSLFWGAVFKSDSLWALLRIRFFGLIFSLDFSSSAKVSKSQKQVFLKLHCPKSDPNFWQISAPEPFTWLCLP